jgi:O-antigen ligase
MALAPHLHPSQHSLTIRFSGILICFLIGFLPITMMTELRGASANIGVLVITSIVLCCVQPGGIGAAIQALRPYKVLFFALLVMPLTVLMSMLWSHVFLGGDVERAIRVFVGTLAILAACLALNPAWLRQSIWGLMAGVIGGTGNLIWASWPHLTRPDMDQYTTVGFSNILLLLTILVLFSLGWQLSRFKRAEQLLKITVVFIGLFGVIIAETRGSWVAMPFFIVIGLILISMSISVWRLMLIGFVAVAIAIGVFFANPSLSSRANLVFKQYEECRSTTPIADNSVCTRIQLWRASWHMFKANPLLANAGAAGFEEKLLALHKKGIISELTSTEFGEPHNDLLFALTNYGLMGLLAFLFMYCVPALMFAWRLKTRFPQEIRVAAAMGLAACAGFVAFGLTETMFRSMRMLSFYSVLIAWLLALSHFPSQKSHPT